MTRIILFFITNLAVMSTFSLILFITGIESNSLSACFIMSGLFGFSGSLISLITSKWIALRSVNGKIIKNPNNDIEDWLINTITKQSLKKGIKTPQIAIYESLHMNAFATGAHRNAALIAVSTGLLDNMTKSEGEAVIAHEISHIANGDMITMTLIQGVVNTFTVFVSHVISQVLNGFLSENKDENNEDVKYPFIFLIISIILEFVFGLLASVITMSFSRYREFYADAGSAKLVGRDKMIAALNRLKLSYEPKESNAIISFCINGQPKPKIELLASHPSIEKRIQALKDRKYM